jgi:hypothetical protein
MARQSVSGRGGAHAASRVGLLLVIAGLIAAGCGGAAREVLSSGGGPLAEPAATAGPAQAARDGELGTLNGPPTGGATNPAGSVPDVAGPLIVRTGQLDLQVADLEAAIRAAEAAVTAVGGYVAGSQRSGDADRASASLIFRVPAARWMDTLDALRKLGAKILAEQTSSQEVTAQVVDLGARLENLRASEAALQGIMQRAAKIPDVLAVQEQLTGVRQQIEELTAQKQNLENQAALATLTVNFTLPPAVAVTQVSEGWDPAREIDQAAAALVGLGQGLARGGIWLLIVWLPIFIVGGLLALGVFAVARRIRRTAPSPSSPAGAAEA